MSKSSQQPLAQGSTIGILGGGQLGRMLAMAAGRLGYRVIVLDPDADCPAGQMASQVIAAPFDDAAALARLCGLCQVATFEFENIPVATIRDLGRQIPVWPPVEALENSQDRLVEKRFLNRLGIETAPYFDIASAADLREALLASGGRGILKTRRMGYDGKGQHRLDDVEQAETAWTAMAGQACILEGYIDFTFEISVIAARSANGDFAAFDPPSNEHRNGILRKSSVPAINLSQDTAQNAVSATRAITDALDYCGVIGVEFFVRADGSLVANEMAPRVHNSGHWTEAACTISQFEQHIRAISGMPLGDPRRHSDCEMHNLIGDEINELPRHAAVPGAYVHSYGKTQARPGRKMGHVTFVKTGMKTDV